MDPIIKVNQRNSLHSEDLKLEELGFNPDSVKQTLRFPLLDAEGYSGIIRAEVNAEPKTALVAAGASCTVVIDQLSGCVGCCMISRNAKGEILITATHSSPSYSDQHMEGIREHGGYHVGFGTESKVLALYPESLTTLFAGKQLTDNHKAFRPIQMLGAIITDTEAILYRPRSLDPVRLEIEIGRLEPGSVTYTVHPGIREEALLFKGR